VVSDSKKVCLYRPNVRLVLAEVHNTFFPLLLAVLSSEDKDKN